MQMCPEDLEYTSLRIKEVKIELLLRIIIPFTQRLSSLKIVLCKIRNPSLQIGEYTSAKRHSKNPTK